MDAGKLDRRILIKTASYAQDAYGEQIATESTVATVWAQLLGQTVNQIFTAGADQAAQNVIFQIRKRTDVTAAMIVVYGSQRFEIAGIVEVGRNNRLNLICQKQGANI